jgi:hypothetical protein
MSKLLYTDNRRLSHNELDYDFETFDNFSITLTADSAGFQLTIADKGWSGKTLTFTLDTCMQDKIWDLEVENNE